MQQNVTIIFTVSLHTTTICVHVLPIDSGLRKNIRQLNVNRIALFAVKFIKTEKQITQLNHGFHYQTYD